MTKIPAIITTAILLTQSAVACMNPPGWTISDDIQRADAIFVGEVQAIEIQREWALYENGESVLGGGIVFPEHGLMYRPATTFTIVVDKAWKGVHEEIVTVMTGWSSCGADLRIARRYLFYAYKIPDGGLAVSTLSVRQTGDASKDFELLGPPVRDYFADKVIAIKRELAAQPTYREAP